MSSDVLPLAGPAPLPTQLQRKRPTVQTSASFIQVHFSEAERSSVLFAGMPPGTPNVACYRDADSANSPGTIPVSVGAE